MKSWTNHLALISAAIALTLVGAGACVFHTESKIETTSKIDAHIVLDIRQVKDDASQVEGYVRGQSDQPPAAVKNAPGNQPTSSVRPAHAAAQLASRSWLSALDPSGVAWAAETTPAKVTPEAEKKAVEARKARFEKLSQAMKDGALGENDRGYAEVLVKAAPDAKDADKAKIKALQTLADDENRDRKTIYLATAQRAGGNASNLPEVEKVYAEQIRTALKAGQMFQAPQDKKVFEDFQKTTLGKLYADAKAGDWLKKKDK